VTSIADERGFTGKIIVLGDPETKKGDCALQWADGGITLDFEKTSRKISQLVRRHLDRLISQSPEQSQAQDAVNATGPDSEAVPKLDPELQSQTEIEPVSETETGPGETK